MGNNELKERICSLSNEELIKLLKLRESYQPEAVQIAIKEAIKRKLIQSEVDLTQEKFRPEKRKSKSLFPHLDNETHFLKVFTSLVRILYLIAIIPVIFGLLKLVEYQFFYGFILLGTGLLWIGLSLSLQKKKQSRIPWILLLIFVGVVSFVLCQQIDSESYDLSDLPILTLAILLVFYVLTYLGVLLARQKNKE